MKCRGCHARLEYEDNYCRKCGAAVEYLEVVPVQSAALPARRVAAIRAMAVPAVTGGATAIVAGTVLRLALRHLLSRPSSRGLLPFGRRSLELGEIEEVILYRRTRAG